MRKRTFAVILGVTALLTSAYLSGCSSDSSTAPVEKETPAPNLAVISIQSPPNAAHMQDIPDVTTAITNSGNLDSDRFSVRVSLAYDDKGTDAIAMLEADTVIAPGDTISLSTGAFAVPLDATIGDAVVLVELDRDGVVGESNENDNTMSRAIEVAPISGYVYRWAGVVNGGGFGIPGDGLEGQRPHMTNLYWPQDVSFDAQGSVYVADWNNHRILKLDDDGNFYELIGGRFGDAPDGVAREIGLNHPTDVTFDPQGNLILSAWHNSTIKKMNLFNGMIATICGIDNDVNNRKYNGDEIPAEEAYLDLPVTCVFDSQGNMYFGDQGSMIVRKIDTQGIIHTIAGQPPTIENGVYFRHRGYGGDGGLAVDALLNFEFGQAANPSGRICFDSQQEHLYIADTVNNAVRVVDMATGIITTFAGMGPNAWGYDVSDEGGPATAAKLFKPRDVVCDADDNLYIADTGNQCIRMVDGSGNIWTVAGVPTAGGGPGTARGVPALQAKFASPYGVEIGPNGNLWIADQENNVIRILYF